MIKGMFTAACLWVAGLGLAGAQSFHESTALHESGDWKVDLSVVLEDGTLWCSALTRNDMGQRLRMTALPDGAMMVSVEDPLWRIRPARTVFGIAVGDSIWLLDGQVRDSLLYAAIEPDRATRDLLTALAQGHAAAAVSSQGQLIAGFSLDGSFDALTELQECRTRILYADVAASGEMAL